MSTPDLSPREETRSIAGIHVVLTWPPSKDDAPINGVTFLLTGAMVSISEYNGLRDVILEKNHLVLSLFMNPLWPLRNNHRRKAENVKNIFAELQSTVKNLPNIYSIVGHSMGGKVALLVASLIDPGHVKAVLALDPVDINPVEFTNENGRSNLPLNDSGSSDDNDDAHNANDNGNLSNRRPIINNLYGWRPGHFHTAQRHCHSQTTPQYNVLQDEHSGHMAYCDHGGGWAGSKLIMPDVGTPEGNEAARSAAHQLIRQMLA